MPHCNAWNTSKKPGLKPRQNRMQGLARGLNAAQPVTTLADIGIDVSRTPPAWKNWIAGAGGGIVAGGVVLIGGDPGIGQIDPAAASARRPVASDAGAIRDR